MSHNNKNTTMDQSGKNLHHSPTNESPPPPPPPFQLSSNPTIQHHHHHHHVIDPDILLDRLGLEELKIVGEQSSIMSHPAHSPLVQNTPIMSCSSSSSSSTTLALDETTTTTTDLTHTRIKKTLATLPERMSEDSLEDNHAFMDITINPHHTYEHQESTLVLLEPLQEEEVGDDDDDEEDKDKCSKENELFLFENQKEVEGEELSYNIAPLHLNPLRISTDIRLTGSSSSSLQRQHSFSSRSSSRSRTPRDVSPAPGGGGGSSDHLHHSSIPSMIDPDILLDRLGLVELEPTSFLHHPSSNHHNQYYPIMMDISTSTSTSTTTTTTMTTTCPSSSQTGILINNINIPLSSSSNTNPSLPSLPERLSEETLDDCHAFTEFKFVSRPRLGSSSSSNISQGGVGVGTIGVNGVTNISGTTSPATITPMGSSSNLVGLLFTGGITTTTATATATTTSRDTSATNSISGGSILSDNVSLLLETLEEFEEEEEEEEEDNQKGIHIDIHSNPIVKPSRIKDT